MTPLPSAHAVGPPSGPRAGTLSLPSHARSLRRRRVTTDEGAPLLVDLAESVALEDGDALLLEDGRHVLVRAAPEALLEARGASPGDLARLAWHVGNRHAPCEVGDGWLRVPFDRPMEAMLRGLGAEASRVEAPFRPERGAYAGHAHGGGQGEEAGPLASLHGVGRG